MGADELAETVATLDRLLADNGRTRDGFVLQTGVFHGAGGEGLTDYVKACADIGIERLVLSLPLSRRTFSSELERYAGILALPA